MNRVGHIDCPGVGKRLHAYVCRLDPVGDVAAADPKQDFFRILTFTMKSSV